MPRKQRARVKYVKEQQASTDRLYDSRPINKLIKMVMMKGKYNLASKIVYGSLDHMYDDYMKQRATSEEKKLDKVDVVRMLVERLIASGPIAEVKTRRIGGANYQVPIPVEGERRLTLVFRWLIDFARKRKGHSMMIGLGRELVDLISGRGSVAKTRENVEKMAKANAGFGSARRRKA